MKIIKQSSGIKLIIDSWDKLYISIKNNKLKVNGAIINIDLVSKFSLFIPKDRRKTWNSIF